MYNIIFVWCLLMEGCLPFYRRRKHKWGQNAGCVWGTSGPARCVVWTFSYLGTNWRDPRETVVVCATSEAASTTGYTHGSVEGTSSQVTSVFLIWICEETSPELHQGKEAAVAFSGMYAVVVVLCELLCCEIVKSICSTNLRTLYLV
jgi:hypothetical protein